MPHYVAHGWGLGLAHTAAKLCPIGLQRHSPGGVCRRCRVGICATTALQARAQNPEAKSSAAQHSRPT